MVCKRDTGPAFFTLAQNLHRTKERIYRLFLWTMYFSQGSSVMCCNIFLLAGNACCNLQNPDWLQFWMSVCIEIRLTVFNIVLSINNWFCKERISYVVEYPNEYWIRCGVLLPKRRSILPAGSKILSNPHIQ